MSTINRGVYIRACTLQMLFLVISVWYWLQQIPLVKVWWSLRQSQAQRKRVEEKIEANSLRKTVVEWQDLMTHFTALQNILDFFILGEKKQFELHVLKKEKRFRGCWLKFPGSRWATPSASTLGRWSAWRRGRPSTPSTQTTPWWASSWEEHGSWNQTTLQMWVLQMEVAFDYACEHLI